MSEPAVETPAQAGLGSPDGAVSTTPDTALQQAAQEPAVTTPTAVGEHEADAAVPTTPDSAAQIVAAGQPAVQQYSNQWGQIAVP